MKKLIAMLACLTLIVTMFAGLTVSATEVGKIILSVDETGAWTDNGDGTYSVLVNVNYDAPYTYVAYNEDDYSASGLNMLQFTPVLNNSAFAIQAFSTTGTELTGVKATRTAGKVTGCLFAATDLSEYRTVATGFVGAFKLKTSDPAASVKVGYDTVNTMMALATNEYGSQIGKQLRYSNNQVAAAGIEYADLEVTDLTVASYNDYMNPPAGDPVVTYEGEANVVWGAKGAYAEGKATFSVKPVMGYTIAVTANGDEVAIDAAKGGEVTIDVTEDTTVVATATAITDGAYTYGETYKDGNTVYVFGKAAVAPFGFYVEKDGAALANKALEIYDGKFAANGTAGAFGMAFTFTGKGHTGAYTAKAYDANGTADTFASFNID